MAFSGPGHYKYKKTVSKRRRRGPKKSSNSIMNIATQALKTANFVRKLINVEKKWFDGQNAGYPAGITINSTGNITHVSNITQGDSANSRDGNSVKLASIYITGRASLATAATSSQQIRVMLVRDNDNQGAAPSVANILQSVLISSPLNLNNPGRFSVLWDEVFTLLLNTAGASQIQFEKFIETDFHIKYGGNAGTIADAREGNLFMMAISDQGTDLPFLIYNVRLRYIDN